MSDPETNAPWIEQPDGTRIPVRGSCSIGRLPSNQIILAEERVSRRHALVNAQEDGEFWLVDLGSGNGTYLNGRRLVQPTILNDGDRIEIGSFQLAFRRPSSASDTPRPGQMDYDAGDKTIQHIKSSPCWLLVADITESTSLIKKLPEDELPKVTGQWLADCRRVIEECGGSINKFLGDGFFAYWTDGVGVGEQVVRAILELHRMQDLANPSFRVVLHHGQVFMGGAASMGEESLMGKEVHFVFRMEKLASALGERGLVSDPARQRLPGSFQTLAAGQHPVQSFDGEFAFHSYPARLG
jgi:class 3 adenylate cyclase